MSEPKSEFWWASVSGADCEPVEVTTLDGERVAYTCGCADPFYLDRPDNLIVLVSGPEDRPLTPAQTAAKEAAWQRQLKRDAKRGIHHGWRGPR